jgi:H+/gluconate symporter-like permease
MTITGLLILVGFFLFAGLMITKVLPTILALPLLAAWVALVVQLPFVVYVNTILLQGSMKLGSAMAVVIFGAMFARVIMKTGISGTIIKKAAELAGDDPLSLAFVMTAATAFVFLGMSGLGAVIMVGSITIPIMISAGISPLVACVLLLFGLQTGLLANAANYGTYIGIFGGEITASYYAPAFCISALVTIVFILRNVKNTTASGSKVAVGARLSSVIRIAAALPIVICHALRPHRKKTKTSRFNGVMKKRERIPALALLAPMLPLITVFVCKGCIGFGKAEQGLIDPVAASVLGFILASVYAILLTRPTHLVGIFSGSLIEGIKDIAGVLFLFMGIGMLVAAVMNPAVAAVLNPLLAAIVPEARWLVFLFFAILAPTALYRGPLNMFGMGAGIAALLVSLHILSPMVVAGCFLGVQYIQGASDPTNSHNTWIGGFAKVDTTAILKKSLPYTWVMCILMLVYVMLLKW